MVGDWEHVGALFPLSVERIYSRISPGLDLYDFDPHHRRAGVGILVDPLYQKNGLATEALELLAEYAFSYLKLHQLFVHIPIGNEPSKALFARCGFTVTGILTDWITTKDGYSDVLTMQKINERNL